jgi:hypothetical protein
MTDTPISERIEASHAALGHPHNDCEEFRHKLPVTEGTHYDVLAYTIWADYFTATVVEWHIGSCTDVTDSFSDTERSMAYQNAALAAEKRGVLEQ